ncbi:MAG: quinoprotein relay system zinc metallohydrolase 2 [Amaricoccus sp.]|uniref:quinoprotein relay system zinc metallohydrolase 2 n=1 Tax=Amaricoccus sp. TaxID=1872485 RepID=UPI0039E303C8
MPASASWRHRRFCSDRLLPGDCAAERAGAWVAAHPGLSLAGSRCVTAAEVPALAVAEVAPGVFVHTGAVALASPENGGDIANLGFVIGQDAVAVVDAGNTRAIGEALYAAIRARTDLPVRWLILTHMHPDHVFGAEVFREAGARIVASDRLPAALGARAESYVAALERQVGPVSALGSRLVLPDQTVTASETLDLGGRALRLSAEPTAHTDNDLTVRDTATDTWFLGDLVFDRHTPSLDGSVLGWIEVLRALAAEPAARVVPGHGGPVLGWPSGAAPTAAYLAGLVAETRAALDAGESLGAASRHVGADLADGWQLFDDFNARNATTAYRELEWE